MGGLGWTEMMLIGIVALIVVGPKDLPNMFRALGQFTGKARSMAREFSRAMESAADDAGVKDISQTIRAAANPRAFATDRLKEAAGVRTPAGGLPKAGSPVVPKPEIKPGGATEALSAERAAARERIQADIAARAEAKRAAAEAAPDGRAEAAPIQPVDPAVSKDETA